MKRTCKKEESPMSDKVKLTWGKAEHDLSERWPKSADGTPEEPGEPLFIFLTVIHCMSSCSGISSMGRIRFFASSSIEDGT